MAELSRNQMIIYINDHINEIKYKNRVELLQKILCSNISDKKIIEKGNGTQIKYSYLNDDLLQYIYNYIFNKIENEDILF